MASLCMDGTPHYYAIASPPASSSSACPRTAVLLGTGVLAALAVTLGGMSGPTELYTSTVPRVAATSIPKTFTLPAGLRGRQAMLAPLAATPGTTAAPAPDATAPHRAPAAAALLLLAALGYAAGRRGAMAPYTGHKESTALAAAPEETGLPDVLQEEQDEKKRKVAELRAQERFMRLGTGNYQCQDCAYTYQSSKGDPEYPIAPGTTFQDLPGDWVCPVCGAPKTKFQTDGVEVAGFAVNQGYGLGTNALTGEQKSLTIYSSLLFFFFLFIGGYFLR